MILKSILRKVIKSFKIIMKEKIILWSEMELK